MFLDVPATEPDYLCQEWLVPQQTVQRHVRQYASLHGINSNDEELGNATSYSTRVERIHKSTNSSVWTLTLRRFIEIPSSSSYPDKVAIKADWWTEEFDGVVVATASEDSAYVPNIPGLGEWARAYPKRIYHSRNYRTPNKLTGKVRFRASNDISVPDDSLGAPSTLWYD